MSDPLLPERTYTGDNIKILEGLEAVRLRPAMYIGSTGDQGLHHLVYEVVDNSVDEALAGYATHVDVTIHIDNSITVTDDGRGIPIDEMDVPGGERMPALQVVLTKLHAGGKFDSSTYKVSGGLHGVGVSCVNALSEELDVEVWKDLHTYEQTYAKGAPVTKLRQTGNTKKQKLDALLRDARHKLNVAIVTWSVIEDCHGSSLLAASRSGDDRCRDTPAEFAVKVRAANRGGSGLIR